MLLASTYDFTGKEVWEDTGYLPKSHEAVTKKTKSVLQSLAELDSTAGLDRAVRAALPGLSNSITFEDVGHMYQTQTTHR